MAKPFTEEFGGEARSFRVLLGELEAIQRKCEAGPATVAARLARCVETIQQHPKASMLQLAALGLGEWRVQDVREPIFQGLIGGGMAPNEASRLVRTWIDERGLRGLIENAGLALVCLVTGFEDPEGDDLGEVAADRAPTTA